MNIKEQVLQMNKEQYNALVQKLYNQGFVIDNEYNVVKRVDSIKERPIEKVENKELYSLSPAQKRLWILDKLEDRSTAYNIPGALKLTGSFDEEAFNKAYYYILQRHESLRTVFTEDNGEPKQKILEVYDFKIEKLDLSSMVDINVFDILDKEMNKTFDLSKGPLIRFYIIKLSCNEHILFYNMHHIITDGWSIDIFIKEFFGAYNVFKVNGIPKLSPLRIQYKDYANWLEVNDNDINKQNEYWKNKLSGEIQAINLPEDFPRPALKSFNGNRKDFYIPIDSYKSLEDIKEKSGSSMFMIFQALIKVLLYKYTSQTDLIIGTPVAGRTHKDTEDQIGFYMNNLALKDTINHKETFIDFLSNVKKTSLEAFDHQDISFDKVIGELNLERDLSRSPLFDVMVVYQNNDLSNIIMDDLEVEDFPLVNKVSKYDLTFTFTNKDDSLLLQLEYNTDIYSDDRIKRIYHHFIRLILDISSNPYKMIKDLEILPDNEKDLIINTFNNTAKEYPEDLVATDLFEQIVKEYPGRFSVLFNDIALTYKELNEKANILANFLRSHYKIKPDDLIGVVLNRSEYMAITLLGILKAGGAYVPIDPTYPKDRIDYILDDSKPCLILSNFDLNVQQNIDVINPAKVIDKGGVTSNPVKITDPSSLAYVIYTSGSTGNPKGTLIEHGSLVNRLHWMQKSYPLGQDDAILQKTTYTFDVSVWELFWWAFYGAKVVFLQQGEEKDPKALVEAIEKFNITTIHFVPSMFTAFLEYVNEFAQHFRVKSLKYIINSGEALTPKHIRLSNRLIRDNGTKIVNLYGPTEATIDVTYYNCEENDTHIPIGKPISNINAYIVDKNFNLQPIGVPGELCVSGIGVGRGYLNKDDLTLEKFIQDPFDTTKRMYRTGDLAKWLPDGNIDFLGRIDNQVKVRGFRIELGEIEKQIIKFEAVTAAVVIVRKNSDGINELAAYYTGEKDINPSTVRIKLLQILPEYMIPLYFIQIEHIPLSSNGKVNRKMLPDPKSISLLEDYVAPASKNESKLESIWSNVLEQKKISIIDNFFTIGGDSIKAIRLINLINKEFDTNIKVYELYNLKNIRSMALRIGKKEDSLTLETKETEHYINNLKHKVINSLDNDNIEDVYPMSDIENGMFFSSLIENGDGTYHDQFVYQLKYNSFDDNRFTKAMKYLVNKHSILRTAYNLTDFETGVHLVYKSINLNLEFRNISSLSNSDKEKTIKEFMVSERNQSFDHTRPGLWKMTIFKQDSGSVTLVWQFHHAILDGWSNASIITELNNIYTELEINKDFYPQPLRSDYGDFIVEHLSEQKNKDSIKYWQNELDEYKRVNIFNDKSDCIVEVKDFYIDKKLYRKIKELSIKNNITEKSLFLGSFLYLVNMLQFENDLTIGYVTNTRPASEDSDKIAGCFLNTIPYRSIVTINQSWREFIESTNNKINELKRWEKLSLFNIAHSLGENTSNGNPFFDVIFNFVDFHIYNDASYDFNQSKKTELNLSGFEKTNTIFDFSVGITNGIACVHIDRKAELYGNIRNLDFFNKYVRIIENIVDKWDSIISESSILNRDEKDFLLNKLNDTSTNYPVNKGIVELFEEQVVLNPDKVAVTFKNKSLTYSELNNKANIIANYLIRNYSTKADDFIGVMLNSSEKMIPVLLGILKSGAAYVPIDPGYPVDRIKYMIEDSNVKVVISNSSNGIYVDVNSILDNDNLAENPALHSGPNNLAYIIYTSGSTGKPKGTLIEQKSVIRLVKNTNYITIKSSDNIVQLSNYAFDGSIFGIFGALLNGARLIMTEKSDVLDIEKLSNIFTNEKITVMFVTTALFNSLVENSISSLRGLRKVLFGGEQCSVTHIDRFIDEYGSGKLLHVYGPTENTVFSTYFEINNKINNTISYPIGKSISNSTSFVVCKEGQLLPQGIPGELWVAGDGLARGYLNRTELTKDKFFRSSINVGAKVYKTGDLVKLLPEGDIEFLGRIDNQVKIRGFRIEPAEIKSVIEKFKDIAVALVVVRGNLNGKKELVTYYVSEYEVDRSKLVKFLENLLPDYMIPSYFIHMSEFPLTVNGKIDQKKLPEPDWDSSVTISNVKAETPIEIILEEIWKDILGRKNDIGVHENFFMIGGDSISSMHVVHRSRKRGIHFKIKDFMENPTIKQLAGKVSVNKVASNEFVESGTVPFTPVQKWFFDFNNDDQGFWNMNVGLNFGNNLDLGLLEKSINLVINHHDTFKINYRYVDGSWEQFFFTDKDISLKIEKISISMDDRHEVISNFSDTLDFDIEKDLLIKAAAFIYGNNEAFVVLTIHHLVFDVVSHHILYEDIQTVYNALKEGKKFHLDKTTSFMTWSDRLYNYSIDNSLDTSYWENLINKEYFKININPGHQSFIKDFNIVNKTLSKDLFINLSDTDLLSADNSFKDLFLAAYSHSIKEVFGSGKLMVEFESHGREELFEDIDLTRTIGWFTNKFPIYIDVKDSIEDTVDYISQSFKDIGGNRLNYNLCKYFNNNNSLSFDLDFAFNYFGQLELNIESNSDILQKDIIQNIRRMGYNNDIYITFMFNIWIINGEINYMVLHNNKLINEGYIDEFIKNFEETLKLVILEKINI